MINIEMRKSSIYKKIFKNHYQTIHSIAYKTTISFGPIYIHSSVILYNLYKKHIIYSSLFPAPRLHLFHPDKIKTRHRRLQTVINNHPKLTEKEKIDAYIKLRNTLMKRMKQSRIKYSFDSRWIFNRLINRYDVLIKQTKQKQI